MIQVVKDDKGNRYLAQDSDGVRIGIGVWILLKPKGEDGYWDKLTQNGLSEWTANDVKILLIKFK